MPSSLAWFYYCIVLTGELDRDISIQLTLLDGGSADFSDFNTSVLTYTYTFVSGSISGNLECNTVGISRDGLVEDREDISFELRATPEADDVLIIEGSRIISIKDSPRDGMYRIRDISYMLKPCLRYHYLLVNIISLLFKAEILDMFICSG